MAISFETIGNGGLAGNFSKALALIGRNIINPNMDPQKPRKINVEIVFKPSGAGTIDITYEVKPVLAGFTKSSTVFLIGQDARTGNIQMNEYGNGSAPMKIEAEPQMTQAEVVVPEQAFSPETGEIYGAASQGPIDLRAVN